MLCWNRRSPRMRPAAPIAHDAAPSSPPLKGPVPIAVVCRWWLLSMKEDLRHESEKLVRSWMRHEATWLRDYLVATVEDPRINFQSILSRHFLTRELFGGKFEALMEHEYVFAAVMNWLLSLDDSIADTDDLRSILFSLRRGADN